MMLVKIFAVLFATLGLVMVIVGSLSGFPAALVVGGILMGYALGIGQTVRIVEDIRAGRRTDRTREQESPRTPAAQDS